MQIEAAVRYVTGEMAASADQAVEPLAAALARAVSVKLACLAPGKALEAAPL
jgi:hypothetical protein